LVPHNAHSSVTLNIAEADKPWRLVNLLPQLEIHRTIIFVNTGSRASGLHMMLTASHITSVYVYPGMSKEER
jgi:superfamily II DNA/RNA helicase